VGSRRFRRLRPHRAWREPMGARGRGNACAFASRGGTRTGWTVVGSTHFHHGLDPDRFGSPNRNRDRRAAVSRPSRLCHRVGESRTHPLPAKTYRVRRLALKQGGAAVTGNKRPSSGGVFLLPHPAVRSGSRLSRKGGPPHVLSKFRVAPRGTAKGRGFAFRLGRWHPREKEKNLMFPATRRRIPGGL